MSRPFSQSCENNKAPILGIISHEFEKANLVLEIGSYTAQHALYFAETMPELRWQPSDIAENMDTLRAGLAGHALPNVAEPFTLNVSDEVWPIEKADGIFSANTLHIMPYPYVELFFRGVGRTLKPGGKLCVYGPFKYNGEFTTPSNASFDVWLKERDPRSGVRDFEQVNSWAKAAGLSLLADHPMPANNQLLVWEKC